MLNKGDYYNDKALRWAEKNSGPIKNDIIQLLISKGAECKYPLHTAAKNEDIEWSKRLLNEPNADIGVVDDCGRTPIHFAAHWIEKNLDLLILIFNHKTFSIDVLNKKDKNGNTALEWAEWNDRPIKNDIIQLLISKGAECMYPLHTAAK